MTKEKAIQILTRQRDKLDDPKVPNDDAWIFQTADYIRQFFGDNSQQFSYISQFKFGVWYKTSDSSDVIKARLDQNLREVKQFLDNCIEAINDTGLYKPPTTNFLNKLSDTALWTIIPFVVTVTFSAGLLVGKYFSDTQNIELKQELKKCQDNSPITIPTFPNSNPITDTPTNKPNDTAYHK